MKLNKHGMTLTEIMITVAIIGLIAAIAIPNFAKVRERTIAELCAANLKRIEDAKSMWALDTGAAKTDTPTEEELAEYIQGGFPQPIVAGALYTIGNLMTPASCSVHSPQSSESEIPSSESSSQSGGSGESSGFVGLSVLDQLVASGMIPTDAVYGDQGWYWDLQKSDYGSRFNCGPGNYAVTNVAPTIDVNGKVWEFTTLRYSPDAFYWGTYYSGTRRHPDNFDLIASVRIFPETGEITYYDGILDTYVPYNGTMGFYEGTAGPGMYHMFDGEYKGTGMLYFNEEDIPEGGSTKKGGGKK